MISYIVMFVRHYVFCFLGALVRYCYDKILTKREKRNSIVFKDYRDYNEKPDIEMIDAIVGFFVFGVLLIITIPILRRNGW